MPPVPVQRVIAAPADRVPPPFRTFAVRSDEPCHAFEARVPYGQVHVVRADFLDAAALAGLAAQGWARTTSEEFSDIDYASTTPQDLVAAAPHVADLRAGLACALQVTGILGADPAAYRASVATRIDYLAARGASFHNDVRGHWSRCLFWILALQVADVAFVLAHAGVQVPVAAGDLLVFDQTLAHGLARTGDGGQAVEASFLTGNRARDRQVFLTGEVLLSDAQWAALGAPWLPVEEHERRGALDLMVAEFEERSGRIKRPHALRDCMKRSTCYVDRDSAPGDAGAPS